MSKRNNVVEVECCGSVEVRGKVHLTTGDMKMRDQGVIVIQEAMANLGHVIFVKGTIFVVLVRHTRSI